MKFKKLSLVRHVARKNVALIVSYLMEKDITLHMKLAPRHSWDTPL